MNYLLHKSFRWKDCSFFCLCSSRTQAVNYVQRSEVEIETSIVSSGILSPASRLSQHFISSNLLIEPMDYEQQRIISRFLALLPENLQQTLLSSLALGVCAYV